MPGAGTMRLMMELHARDLTGGALNSATANTKRLARTTKAEFSGMMNSVASYRRLVGSIVTAKVLSRGYALLERGIYNVGAAVVDTDQALTAASAKFGDVAARGTEGFSRMEDVVEGIGGSTEFFSNEAAAGLDFLAMAGFDYEQSLKAMVPLTDLATAAQMDLARASDIASDALGAFGLSTDVADIETSLNRVNDVFAETVTSSNTTMETLFDTMKHSGPAVVAAGGDIEMFATLAGKLGSAGIKATIAGTTLKNMFTRLVAPPSEARKALHKLNIDVDDGTGRMKDMITILGELNASFAGRSEISREKFIKDIFGMRAISGVNVLLKEGDASLRAYNARLRDSSGAAKEMADVMRGGLGVQLKVLESAFMQKGFEIFGGLMGEEDPAEAVAELSRVIREFDTGEIVEFLRTTGAIAKGTAEFLWENRSAIASFAKIWLSVSIASRIDGIVRSVISLGAAFTGAGGLAAAAGTTATGLGAVTTASGALRASLLLSQPVILAAVAGLATGYEIWKKIDASRLDAEKAESDAVKLFAGSKEMSLEEASARLKEEKDKFDSPGGKGYTPELAEEILNSTYSGRGAKAKIQAIQALERQVEAKSADRIAATDLRNEWAGGGGPNIETSADFWQMQGLVPSAATAFDAERGPSGWQQSIWDLKPAVKDVDLPEWMRQPTTDQVDSSVKARQPPPAAIQSINWDPEFKIKVDVNGLAPGQTATAEVTHVPSVSEASLGVPNG